MADIAKLGKQATKAADALAAAHIEMTEAIERWGAAQRAYAIAKEDVEHAEALETVRELRGKKGAE